MKRKYKCKVNGCLGRSPCGKYSAMCGKIGATTDNCHAHGNTKCEHKVKIKVSNNETSISNR